MTSTIDKLQALLNGPHIDIEGINKFKALTPAVICMDGASISIQASENHYCLPRENTGTYTHVELWCIKGTDTEKITQFEYDENDPSGYVPIEEVVAFLDEHGGIKE